LEEEREVQKFMKQTITKGTRKNYEAIMRRWVEYREILDPRSVLIGTLTVIVIEQDIPFC
jgi:hypothetical protein